MQAADQSNTLNTPSGHGFEAVLQHIDQFAGEYEGLLENRQSDYDRKVIRQQKQFGEEIKEEAAKSPRDDKRLKGLMDRYQEQDHALKKLSTITEESTLEMMMDIY